MSPTSGGTSERAVWSVSELSRRLAATLEERFPTVWVEGEISNFKVYGSGHAYFTLKDEGAQLRAVLFRNRVRRIRFEPADGLHVLAFGAVEIYAQRVELAHALGDLLGGAVPLHLRRRDHDVDLAEAPADDAQHVVQGGAAGRGHDADLARKARQPALARRIE